MEVSTPLAQLGAQFAFPTVQTLPWRGAKALKKARGERLPLSLSPVPCQWDRAALSVTVSSMELGKLHTH